MASGAAPCSEQRSSSGKAEKNAIGKIRRRAAIGIDLLGARICELCVVCGDAACNHHYYGVVACHGCKCFFWRSIKNKMKYICRGDGHCEINPNHRNVCRYCRLQRCLKAGMLPEAVRMPKQMITGEMDEEFKMTGKQIRKVEKSKEDCSNGTASLSPPSECCPLCHGEPKVGIVQVRGEGLQKKEISSSSSSTNAVQLDGVELQRQQIGIMQQQQQQQQKQIVEIAREVKSLLLVKKLLGIEMTINEVVDFSENEAPKRQIRLESIFDYPQILDRFRTQVKYCVRLRRVTEEEMEFCKYRTLTKAVDYINSLALFKADEIFEASSNPSDHLSLETKGEALLIQDKIVLLRYGFAPLVLFDIAAGTTFATKNTQNLLCLPTGVTLCAGESIASNSFLTQQIVSQCIGSLVRLIAELQLDQEEFVLLKVIIVLGMDSASGEESAAAAGPGSTAGADYFCHAAPSTVPFLCGSHVESHQQQQEEAGEDGCDGRNSHHLLSSSGQRFIEKLRDAAHAALYHHVPRKSGGGGGGGGGGDCHSSSSPSEAALRFANLLHILPKLTLISRDLVEHIRMVHTFPSSSSRPTDPLFFDLFGDIFNAGRHQHQQNISSSSALSSPLFCRSPSSTTLSNLGSSPFENPQRRANGGDNNSLAGEDHHQILRNGSGSCINGKMISSHFKSKCETATPAEPGTEINNTTPTNRLEASRHFPPHNNLLH